VDRHRLNKGGDRDANCALHMIAVNRLSRCERTRAYVQKRSPDGKADLDILRRLKRYIARRLQDPHRRRPRPRPRTSRLTRIGASSIAAAIEVMRP
jgi:hypothetical protein